MHASVEPLRNTLALNTRLFHNCLDGVSDEVALRRPGDATNHIAFVAIHVLDTRYYLARSLGSDIESPFHELLEEAKALDDIDEYPSLDAVRDAWNVVSRELTERLGALDDVELAREAPYDFPVDGGKTVLGMLTFLVQHDTYHIGQLALLRRYVGLDAMSYG